MKDNPVQRPIVAAFPARQVLVVGDVMLDEFIYGKVGRISPEAPVPVVEAERRAYAPGGAANVATNVACLSGRALLGGVVGSDYSATLLGDVLRQHGVCAEGLVADGGRPTITKTRIIAHSQQVVRVDAERRAPLDADLEDMLLRWVEDQMPVVDACILSDYNKGVVSPRLAQRFIRLAREAGKPIVVDPKGTDYAKYRDATVITPNSLEAEQASNCRIDHEDDVLKAARQLQRVLGESAVLITRGAEGMSLFDGRSHPVHIPTVARNVYDVTGAGDTVVSTLALALATGEPLEQAARLANCAAGIVVGKLGTATVTIEELLDENCVS